jgi:endo-beta-N-acetylglucosaminidase D
MTFISISLQDFQRLAPESRKDIFDLLSKSKNSSDSLDMEGELTGRQVISLVQGLSDKSTNILKTMIVGFNKNEIPEDELLKKLNMVGENLTGVWAGITKRARTVSSDPSFYIIEWKWSDEEKRSIGKFHPHTYELLKEYFK